MDSAPAGSEDVVEVATPPDRAPVPMTLPPFRKVTTSPSGGVPRPEPMVAVKVTASPTSDGLSEEERETVLVAFDTFWLIEGEMLPELLASPEYWAVIG